MDEPRSAAVLTGIARLYREWWRFAAGRRWVLAAFMGLLFVAQMIRLSIPYFFGEAVNDLQVSGAQDLAAAGRHVGLAFAAVAVAWALHAPGRVMERFLAIFVRERFADSLYAKAAALPLEWHEGRHSGEIATRMTKATTALFGFSQHQFVYLQNAVSLIGPLAAIAAISWITGFSAFLGYTLIFVLLLRFDRVMVRLIRAENAAERRWQAALLDGLTNIASLRALRAAGAVRKAIAGRFAEVSAPLRRNVVVNEGKWCAIDLLNNGLRTGLVVLYAWLSWREGGAILLGTAVMVHQYSQQVGNVVASMAGHWSDLVRYGADVGGGDAVFDAQPAPEPSRPAVMKEWRHIAVDHLTFRHARGRTGLPTLDDVHLRLERGERIALVGESGSGKSTLLKVLAGLYAPEKVRIDVDGVPCLGLPDLSAIATLVPQEAELFEASLEFNLTLGRAATPADIERVCALSGFDTVLADLPAGLGTAVGERGLDLSGGQRQRLALARGLLASEGSSLLLLDEPTAALDPVTEARVTDALLAAYPDTAIIASVHRLHLLPRFDTVMLMAHGKVVDAGTLDALLERQPLFRTMWERAGETSPVTLRYLSAVDGSAALGD